MSHPTETGHESGQKLRFLTFNIQAGTSTARYHHYVTHSWRQVLPHAKRVENLDAIAELVAPYDMVALQEVDSGSLRSGFINQSRYLANHAGMPFWCLRLLYPQPIFLPAIHPSQSRVNSSRRSPVGSCGER